MEAMQFKFMGEVGDGRNGYILLIEPYEGQGTSYRIRAEGKDSAVKMVESALNCKLEVTEVEKRKKWKLVYKYGSTNPALAAEIYLTKVNY